MKFKFFDFDVCVILKAKQKIGGKMAVGWTNKSLSGYHVVQRLKV